MAFEKAKEKDDLGSGGRNVADDAGNPKNDGNDVTGVGGHVADIEDREDEQQEDEAKAKMYFQKESDSPSSTKESTYVTAGENVDPLQALEEGKMQDVKSFLTCPICLCDIMEQADIRRINSCGHLFCVGCLRDYAKNEISQNRRLKCPRFTECQSFLSKEICNEILSEEETTAYQQILKRDSLVCPKCEARQPYDSSTDHRSTTEIVRCVECDEAFCSIHGDSHKPTLSACRRYVRHQERASERVIRRETKPCPSCKALCVRDGGCNHMNCSLCRCRWCWDCGKNEDLCRCEILERILQTVTVSFVVPLFCIGMLIAAAFVLVYTLLAGIVAVVTVGFGFGCLCGYLSATSDGKSGFSLVKSIVFGPLIYCSRQVFDIVTDDD